MYFCSHFFFFFSICHFFPKNFLSFLHCEELGKKEENVETKVKDKQDATTEEGQQKEEKDDSEQNFKEFDKDQVNFFKIFQ